MPDATCAEFIVDRLYDDLLEIQFGLITTLRSKEQNETDIWKGSKPSFSDFCTPTRPISTYRFSRDTSLIESSSMSLETVPRIISTPFPLLALRKRGTIPQVSL